MTRLLGLGGALIAAVLLGSSSGAAAPVQATKLVGTVGPEFTIALEDARGNPVTKLDPGSYEIDVRDRSDFHTFHLQGPGVDERTEVEFTGDVTWRVTFSDGTYRFFCDVHPSGMRGAFAAGNPPSPSPAPAPAPSPPTTPGVVTAATKLVLTTGPSFVITLKTAAGTSVRSMKKGTYTVSVRDRGRIHNAHLIAPGYDRKTSPLTYTGTQTWKVKLARIGTLRFLCDPHALQRMKGSAKIVG